MEKADKEEEEPYHNVQPTSDDSEDSTINDSDPTVSTVPTVPPCCGPTKSLQAFINAQLIDPQDLQPRSPTRLCYPLDGVGRALLLNNYKFENGNLNLNGAQNDSVRLSEVLTDLKWKVYRHDNLNTHQTNEVLDRFCHDITTLPTFAIIVFIGSHGHSYGIGKDYFLTSDGTAFLFNSVVRKFTEDNLPVFAGKPKIFITSFCRNILAETEPANQASAFLNLKNLHFVHATLPGRPALNFPGEGSAFIQCLCLVIQENAHRMHFQDIVVECFSRVNAFYNGREVYEVPINTATFSKFFYLVRQTQ